MAVNGGPKIPTDGLVLNLDFANFKSNRGRRSLINWNEWTSGSGGTTSYAKNGLESENRRIWDTNPFGNSDIVWDSPTNDVTADGDGGWNYTDIPIDPTKMYRHTVWIRRPTIGNGSSYLGTYGFRDTTNVGVLYRTSGTSTTNPYFRSSGWWGSANTWYLMVGHTWPFDSGTGNIHEDTGVWALDGTRTTTCTDFIWKTADTNKTSHRSYLFYSTNTSTNQQWYQPRIDLCDGTEPTLQELLNDAGNKITDVSYNGNDGLITGSMAIDSDNLGSYDFDGSNDYIDLDITNELDQLNGADVTICAFIKPDTTSNTTSIFTARGGNSNEMHFGFVSNNLNFDRYPPSGGNAASGLSPNVGEWNFVAVSATHASSATFCLNGEFSTVAHTETYTGGTPTKVTIGAQLTNGVASRFYNGKIASVMVFNRSLSEEEIKTLYNSQRGRFGL